MKTFDPRQLLLFRSRLLRWYGSNQRALPWRGTCDPYRIWLSEVMLQQTRVAAVVDYYRRFVAAFPDVHALARARGEAVLRRWAGLGYYSRARNLQAAAKRIVSGHGGRFPNDYAAIRALPGIGDYTAAAIASIAFGEPRAVLDGNVARVLARLFVVRGDLRRSSRWKALLQQAQALLHRSAPGDWNQAMMELGATVCTPRAPVCSRCPVKEFCGARRQGCVSRLPEKRRKRATENVHLVALVCLDAKQFTWLTSDPSKYFSGLWRFPAAECLATAREAAAHLARSYGFSAENALLALTPVRHAVTFRNLTLQPFLLRCRRLQARRRMKRLPLAQVSALATSSATRKIAQTVLQHIARTDRLPP